MDNSQINLDIVSQDIEVITTKIHQFFSTVNSPDNISVTRDRHWGKRTVNMHIRLDEFSVEKLKEAIPRLEQLFNQYKQLRLKEKEFNEQLDIRDSINHTNYDGYV